MNWILIAAGVIGGGCAAFYTTMKTIEKKSVKKREIHMKTLKELTVVYIKDWCKVEMTGHEGRKVSLILPDRIEDVTVLEGIYDLESSVNGEDYKNLLLIIVRDGEEIMSLHGIKFETMDSSLSEILEKNKGVVTIK